MNTEKQKLLEDLAYYVKIIRLQEDAIGDIVEELGMLGVKDSELLEYNVTWLYNQFKECKI